MKKSVSPRLLLPISVALIGLAVWFSGGARILPNELRLKMMTRRTPDVDLFHYYQQLHDHHPELHDVMDPEEGFAPSAASRDAWKNLAGYWQGTLRVQPQDDDGLRLLYRITEQYGQAVGYSLDQGGGLIPATAAGFDPDTKNLLLVFETIGGIYVAKLEEQQPSSAGQLLTGEWRQGGRTFPLDMRLFHPATDDENDTVPREFRFLMEKSVTGDPEQLQQMVGFWSGYLKDDDASSLDQGEKSKDEALELVILQVEKLSADLVEPKVFLPDDTPLPSGIRSFLVQPDGSTKIVLDSPPAIFQGQLVNSTTLMGVVHYDDTDSTQPLTLLWSEHWPDCFYRI